jgi:hypothetical protein
MECLNQNTTNECRIHLPGSQVILECLNQSPGNPLKQDEKVVARVVIIVGGTDAAKTATAQLMAMSKVASTADEGAISC